MIVALGFGAGFFIGTGKKTDTGQLSVLNREVDNLKQQVSLSLLSQPSASARLQGLSMTSRLQDPDPALITALLETAGQRPQRQRAPVGRGRPVPVRRPRGGARGHDRFAFPADIAAGADRPDRPDGIAQGKARRRGIEKIAERQEDHPRSAGKEPSRGSARSCESAMAKKQLFHPSCCNLLAKQTGITLLIAQEARR